MGLGSWINDASKFAGNIAADVAPFVSHSGTVGPATVAPATQTPGTIPATASPVPWYDQPVLVAGIAAGMVAVIIAAVVLTRK